MICMVKVRVTYTFSFALSDSSSMQKIVLETDYGAATVRLIGQGVEPVLQVTPEDGKVDLGQVLAGDSASKTITLKNCSVFPLTYNIVGRGMMPTNYNGTSVFSCIPESAVIEPNATQEVTVSVGLTMSSPNLIHARW